MNCSGCCAPRAVRAARRARRRAGGRAAASHCPTAPLIAVTTPSEGARSVAGPGWPGPRSTECLSLDLHLRGFECRSPLWSAARPFCRSSPERSALPRPGSVHLTLSGFRVTLLCALSSPRRWSPGSTPVHPAPDDLSRVVCSSRRPPSSDRATCWALAPSTAFWADCVAWRPPSRLARPGPAPPSAPPWAWSIWDWPCAACWACAPVRSLALLAPVHRGLRGLIDAWPCAAGA